MSIHGVVHCRTNEARPWNALANARPFRRLSSREKRLECDTNSRRKPSAAPSADKGEMTMSLHARKYRSDNRCTFEEQQTASTGQPHMSSPARHTGRDLSVDLCCATERRHLDFGCGMQTAKPTPNISSTNAGINASALPDLQRYEPLDHVPANNAFRCSNYQTNSNFGSGRFCTQESDLAIVRFRCRTLHSGCIYSIGRAALVQFACGTSAFHITSLHVAL
jgi:hypothetical protein